VIVDFVIEGISVSLGYWSWLSVDGSGGLFSLIPPSNFAGWIGVVFGFILCYEYFEKKWLSMFLGYLVFLVVAVFYTVLSRIFGFSELNNYFTFWIIFFIFVFLFLHFYHENKLLKKDKKELKVRFFYAKYIVYMRVFFYLYALYYFFVNGHYGDFVYDLVLALVVFVEVYFFLRFKGILKKRI